VLDDVKTVGEGRGINRYNYSSPTEAKYAKVSAREGIAKEQELQKVHERIWLPPPVQHSPWD
jgi:hypothetical protein